MSDINDYNSVISMGEKYMGQYEIIESNIYHNGRYYTKVQCPCCKEYRLVRQTLLRDDNKQKMLSTICRKCSLKSLRLFISDKKNKAVSYSFLGGKKIIIDTEDIPKIEWLNLMITDTNHIVINNKHHKTIPLHRYLLNVHNNKDIQCVDHINHNPLDNRKENLRTATFALNSRNCFLINSNRSGFKNIYFYDDNKHNQKWIVQIRINNKNVSKKFYTFLEAYCFWYSHMKNVDDNDFNYNIFNDCNKNLRFASIHQDDIANGIGIGEVLFTQYCSHHCKNCHNPDTWSKDGGYRFTQRHLDILLKYFEDRTYAVRLTLSGGDPLENLEISNIVSAEFKRRFPNKQLWVYTGFKYEDLLKDIKYKPILELCDVLIDGAYVDELRDISLPFRGSSNQRIIDVQKSLVSNQVILWKE